MIPDKGTVLKVINVPKGSWNNMEELLLEELEVFKVRELWKYHFLVCVFFIWPFFFCQYMQHVYIQKKNPGTHANVGSHA